jgi:hypothetical protein
MARCAGVEFDSKGIEVRNWIRVYRLEWQEVASFSLDEVSMSLDAAPRAYVTLHSGRRIAMVGLSALNGRMKNISFLKHIMKELEHAMTQSKSFSRSPLTTFLR